MKTQIIALTRTTASTWGATLIKSRQIYTSVIRSALAYGAPLWHRPDPRPVSNRRGLAREFRKVQNDGLRRILGAFKATPARQLETEAYVPPLDYGLTNE
jgi:hypothetical protein